MAVCQVVQFAGILGQVIQLVLAVAGANVLVIRGANRLLIL
jgi:hypothetical protein